MTLHLATTTAIAGLPDLSAAPARRLASEAEAIAAAHEVAAAIAPITRDHDREGEIPGEQLRLLSESGVTAIAVPKELGGLGASIETIVETVRIISTADGGVGQILQLHNVMIGGILASPDAAYRAFFAPRILAGERFGNALAEVGGKNKLDLRTILSPHDDGSYRLNGRKFYATGSYLAHWLSVGVATPEGGGRGNVIIPRDAPGLTVIDDWRAFGQRNTMSGTVIFEDVHVPAFFSPRGRKPARTALTRAQILHAAIDTGIARGALTAAVDYLRNASRAWIESGEERIVDEPHVIKQVGEFENAVYAAELLLREAARAFDRQLADPDSEAPDGRERGAGEVQPRPLLEKCPRAHHARSDPLAPARDRRPPAERRRTDRLPAVARGPEDVPRRMIGKSVGEISIAADFSNHLYGYILRDPCNISESAIGTVHA